MNLGQKKIQIEILNTEEGNQILVDKYIFDFVAYRNSNELDNYGGKTILDFNGEPVFAELMILKILEKQNFSGVWVDTYRNKFWISLHKQIEKQDVNPKIINIIEEIYKIKSGRKSGCFDVVAINDDDEFIFCELKRGKKDKIRLSQIEWLASAKKLSEKVKFIIAEWNLKA